jgi:hypothetical protein
MLSGTGVNSTGWIVLIGIQVVKQVAKQSDQTFVRVIT